jgi:hypothetical protein
MRLSENLTVNGVLNTIDMIINEFKFFRFRLVHRISVLIRSNRSDCNQISYIYQFKNLSI